MLCLRTRSSSLNEPSGSWRSHAPQIFMMYVGGMILSLQLSVSVAVRVDDAAVAEREGGWWAFVSTNAAGKTGFIESLRVVLITVGYQFRVINLSSQKLRTIQQRDDPRNWGSLKGDQPRKGHRSASPSSPERRAGSSSDRSSGRPDRKKKPRTSKID